MIEHRRSSLDDPATITCSSRRRCADRRIELREIDADAEDPAFVRAMVEKLVERKSPTLAR